MAEVSGKTPHPNGGAAAHRDEIMRVYQRERRKFEDRRQDARRADRRVALQLPVRIRVSFNQSQFIEVSRTVNVCRRGIYFQTERPFAKGVPVRVALNYSPWEPSGQPAEQKGTVVRVHSFPGSTARGVAIQLH
jgi:hypothetical protein